MFVQIQWMALIDKSKKTCFKIYTLKMTDGRCQMQLCLPCNTGHFCICNRVRGYANIVRWTCTLMYMYKRGCMH